MSALQCNYTGHTINDVVAERAPKPPFQSGARMPKEELNDMKGARTETNVFLRQLSIFLLQVRLSLKQGGIVSNVACTTW